LRFCGSPHIASIYSYYGKISFFKVIVFLLFLEKQKLSIILVSPVKHINNFKKPLLAFCLIIILTNLNAQNLGYPSQKSYHLFIGVTTGLVKPKGYKLQEASIAGTTFGFVSQSQFANKYSVWVGLTYAFLETNNYQNTTNYTSEWLSGIYNQEISLQTTIKQQSIQVPIFINRNIGRFFMGAGITTIYLVTTYVNQEVRGTYSPPHNHPNGFINYNKSIQIIFNKEEHNTAPFQKINISPAIQIGYQLRNRFGMQFSAGYLVLQNPHYTNIPFNPYRQLLFNLSLTYKTN
jgi:hypothetical protein